MHIQVSCVIEEYQIFKKLYKFKKKTVIKIMETILHFEFMQIMHICLFIYVFFFYFFIFIFTFTVIVFLTLSRYSAGDLNQNHCGQNYIGEICVMVVFIKITLILLLI